MLHEICAWAAFASEKCLYHFRRLGRTVIFVADEAPGGGVAQHIDVMERSKSLNNTKAGDLLVSVAAGTYPFKR